MSWRTFSICFCRTMLRWPLFGAFFNLSASSMPWTIATLACEPRRGEWLQPFATPSAFAARRGVGSACHPKQPPPRLRPCPSGSTTERTNRARRTMKSRFAIPAASRASSDSTAMRRRNPDRVDAPPPSIAAIPHRPAASSPSRHVPTPLAIDRAADRAAFRPRSAAVVPPARTAATNRPCSADIAGLADSQPYTPNSA